MSSTTSATTKNPNFPFPSTSSATTENSFQKLKLKLPSMNFFFLFATPKIETFHPPPPHSDQPNRNFTKQNNSNNIQLHSLLVLWVCVCITLQSPSIQSHLPYNSNFSSQSISYSSSLSFIYLFSKINFLITQILALSPLIPHKFFFFPKSITISNTYIHITLHSLTLTLILARNPKVITFKHYKHT